MVLFFIIEKWGGDILTKNQKLFVDEYLVDLNATRAYKKAYPNIKNS